MKSVTETCLETSQVMSCNCCFNIFAVRYMFLALSRENGVGVNEAVFFGLITGQLARHAYKPPL